MTTMTMAYTSEVESRPSVIQHRWKQRAFRQKRKSILPSKLKVSHVGLSQTALASSHLIVKHGEIVTVPSYDYLLYRPENRRISVVLNSVESFDTLAQWKQSEPKALADWVLRTSEIAEGSLIYATIVRCAVDPNRELDRAKLVGLLRARLTAVPSTQQQQLESEDAQTFRESVPVHELGENWDPSAEQSLAQLLEAVKQSHLATEKRILAIYAGELLPVAIELRDEL